MLKIHACSTHRTLLALAIGIACFGRNAPAEDAGAQAAKLVKQLGDDDATVRKNAGWRLREIGTPALPGLETAANSDDPQVQTAARSAIKAIGLPLPEAGNGPWTTKLNPTDQEHFSADFSDGKRVVRIEGECQKEGQVSPHNLKMTFTGTLDGKEIVRTFSAENEDDLKWNSPQAYLFYHSIFNRDRAMAAVRVEHRGLTAKVHAAMDQLKFTEVDRKQVEARLKRFDNASARALAACMYDPDNAPQKMAAEYRESDSLRKFLTEKKLPVVDGPWEMSPPPEERLGLYFYTDPKFFPANMATGLLVRFVASGERGDRIGLRPGDIIHKIDGQDITSSHQLRPACKASHGAMTIEIYRDGQPVTLHEKVPAPKH